MSIFLFYFNKTISYVSIFYQSLNGKNYFDFRHKNEKLRTK
jgi:hypothetical protein